MFSASARPKSNPPPRFKTSPNFEESADIYDDQMFGFGRYVPQQYQGPQTDDTSDHTQYPPTNRADRNTSQPRYISTYRTQTSRRGNHQGPDETLRNVADTQSRYVNLDKFDGKVVEWDNWYHQFEFLATHYNWDDRERLARVVFERPCTDSSPKLLPDSTQHICPLHCCTPGETWEQETRPNHNISGRTVHRATGRGGEY